MDATGWTALGAIATGIGSSVSAFALWFIYGQTKATRSAAEATQVQAEIAASALKVAEKEHVQSQFLAIEAVKARFDSQMPSIVLSANDRVEWPPFEPSQYGNPQRHIRAEPFRMPKHADERLIVRLHILLRNESDRTVDLRLSQPWYVDDEDGRRTPMPSEIQLTPGQDAGLTYIDVERTVGEWIEIYEERERTGEGPEYEFAVTYISPHDAGAIDRYRIVLGGTIVQRVENELGAWQVINEPNPGAFTGAVGALGWSAQPTTRTYYLSRTQGVQLPSIDTEVLGLEA